MPTSRSLREHTKTIGLWLGPALFILIQLFADFPQASITHMSAITALMVVWWITEAIPLAATALIPIVLFPLLGISSGKDVARVYMNSTIFLFIGGFIIALAMQRWNLHRRIAMRIIGWFHGSGNLIVMGFMLTAAFLSMWISNTATATMLLPIGLAVYSRCAEDLRPEQRQRLLTAMMLAIAYSCSIGGVATLIGTPPNMVMQRYSMNLPGLDEISFAQWFMFALPLSLTMLCVCWFIITRRYTHGDFEHLSADPLHETLPKMSYEEKNVAVVFCLTALAWMLRKDINAGFFIIPGWSSLLDGASGIDDGTVAIAASLLLFLLPSRDRSRYRNIVDVDIIAEIPWKIVLLFGGGFALATGFSNSGLAEHVGRQFMVLQDQEPSVIIAGISTLVVFLTEVTSNTATSEILLPLMASIATAIDTDPLLLMIPVTLAASMAFMLPVATPPNAIVFASGNLKISDMVSTGLILNLVAIVIITLLTTTWGRFVFGF